MANGTFSDFDADEIDAAMAAAKGEQQQEQQSVVVDPPAPATEGKTTDPPAPTTPPVITNYAEYLAEKSGGLFKTEEDFIASLEKVKNYDSLEVKARDLEAKVPTFKNDETRQWFDLVTSDEGKKALKDYLAETEKDYATMADIDVRREALQKEHPQWSKKDVDLELRHKYGKDLELKDTTDLEDDELEKAEAHNAQVERNLELLAVHARDDRYSLIAKQKLIELPKINKTEIPPAQPAAMTEEEIAANVAKWNKSVDDALPQLPNIKLTIDNKEVEYGITDDEKKAIGEQLKSSNLLSYLKSRGWLNEDNTGNALKIAADRLKLENFDKIVTAMASQVKTPVIRDVLGKIKNVEGNNSNQPKDAVHDSFEEAFFSAGKKFRG